LPSWAESITPAQWRVLLAAGLGWMLDALDVMLYAYALGAIRAEFGLDAAQAGALASVTLLASAAGGILFGILADRIGRAKALVVSILTYSVFTALTATSRSVAEIVVWRALVGIGLGGEWSAGSVLVAETWPARHRGKAIGIMQSGWAVGYAAAAILSAVVLPAYGWRVLFAIGIAPALLTVWIRLRVEEPEIWRRAGRRPSSSARALLAPPLLGRAAISTALATSLLFAYWGLFTWIPSYLAGPEAAGGAGLGVTRSALWIVAMQAGAFLGYASFGFLADRFGRRPTLQAFVLGAAVLVPAYGLSARSGIALLALGPLVGFFGHGYFSVFGAMLAELFPSAIRGTAQGLCYNAGRAASALAPWTIGAVADAYGLGVALAFTSAFFLLGAVLVLLLPETRGEELT